MLHFYLKKEKPSRTQWINSNLFKNREKWKIRKLKDLKDGWNLFWTHDPVNKTTLKKHIVKNSVQKVTII